MGLRTCCAVLASLALLVAPLAAQDTTGTKKDTTGAKPAADTTGARRDTIVIIRDTTQPVLPAPDTTRKDTAAAAPAQDNAVRPGMSEADVEARWGKPIATRTANDWTYLFYRNEQERWVGYYDVVFLQRGQVMDAIVRSPDHVYAGESSSPEGRTPLFTPPRNQAADTTGGAAVTGVRVKPSP